MDELLKLSNKDKAAIMTDLLESVQTLKLKTASTLHSTSTRRQKDWLELKERKSTKAY